MGKFLKTMAKMALDMLKRLPFPRMDGKTSDLVLRWIILAAAVLLIISASAGLLSKLGVKQFYKKWVPSTFTADNFTKGKDFVSAEINSGIGKLLAGPHEALPPGDYLFRLKYQSERGGATLSFLPNRTSAPRYIGALPENGKGWYQYAFSITPRIANPAPALVVIYEGTGKVRLEGLEIKTNLFSKRMLFAIGLQLVGSLFLFGLLFFWKERIALAKVIASVSRKFITSRVDMYFYKELIPNYLFGLTFFTVLLMSNELFFLARYYIEYNVPFKQVMILLFNMVPFLLSYSMPFAVLPAYLLTMGRLSQDSEIVAMKACGISAIRIIRPGILFGVLLTLFSLAFNDLVVVPANLTYLTMRAKMMAQKPAVELKEKAFVEVGGYKLSFDRVRVEDHVEVMYNIHVVDINGRKTIEGEKGRLYSDPENPEHYILKFMNGTMSEVTKTKKGGDTEEESFFVVSFKYLSINTYVNLPDETVFQGPDTMTYRDLRADILSKTRETTHQIEIYLADKQQVRKDIDRLYNDFSKITGKLDKEELKQKKLDLENQATELRSKVKAINQNIDNTRKSMPVYYLLKLNEKLALPIAAFVFALISLSLGMYTARSGRGEGLGISIIIVLSYFGFKVGVNNLMFKYLLPVWAEWLPNIVFFTVGFVLLIRKMRE